MRTEGAVPEASRDEGAREQQNVPRMGTGRCTAVEVEIVALGEVEE